MSDASQPTDNKDAKEKAPAAAEKPAAPAKPEPAPIQPGKFGQLLEKAGFAVQHLGLDNTGIEMVQFEASDALRIAQHLRDAADCRFDLLANVTAVDRKSYRESVYHIYSTETHEWLIFKLKADESDKLPSMFPVWPACDWHEREAYDLMGIQYEGHPDLKRILMPYEWIGHPLRKDYVENDPRLVWNRR
jgi:NADH-quinone oxidoreductase subunit C